ncbi:MAG: hypothetical protein MJ137_08490 [Clostridia bacterium]|nr:hypothetical protein [Clostridia bacterium]
MKKVLSFITAVVMVFGLFAAALPAFAEENLYDKSVDGELLYKVDFSDNSIWKPEQTGAGNLIVTVDQFNSGKATFTSGTDKAQNRFGGEFEGLPLNEKTAYTIYFTEYRDKTEYEKDGNLGVFVDDVYGIYGYSNKVRILNKTSSIAGHDYITFADTSFNVEGDTFAATGVSEQRYCIEVNGQKQTLKIYAMDKNNKYVLIDETEEGDIPFFATDNLGLYFYQYNTGMAVSVYDIEIYRGFGQSDDKIEEIPETTDAETTAAPVVTTEAVTTEEITTAPVGEATTAGATAAGDVTTKAPESTEKNGCGASAAAVCVVIAAVCGTALVRRKEH